MLPLHMSTNQYTLLFSFATTHFIYSRTLYFGTDWTSLRPCRDQTDDDFLYIGKTERRLCDRIQEHRGYAYQADKSQPVGNHFSQNGHNVGDIVAYGIEEVFPKKDPLTIINREKLWIKRYGAIEHGNNRRLWTIMSHSHAPIVIRNSNYCYFIL